MTYRLTPDEFLDAVFNTVRETVNTSKQQHPEDIMATVSLVTETIYQFVSLTPTKMWFE